MTGPQTSHITVNYQENGAEFTCIYEISEELRREMKVWSGKRKNPTDRDLLVWLNNKGCRLDSSGGPAYVQRDADGSTVEAYYRDGIAHREDGPAIICHNTDGGTVERYYRDGKFVKTEYRTPPSPVTGVTVLRFAPKAPGPS